MKKLTTVSYLSDDCRVWYLTGGSITSAGFEEWLDETGLNKGMEVYFVGRTDDDYKTWKAFPIINAFVKDKSEIILMPVHKSKMQKGDKAMTARILLNVINNEDLIFKYLKPKVSEGHFSINEQAFGPPGSCFTIGEPNAHKRRIFFHYPGVNNKKIDRLYKEMKET